jgi:mitochondrial import receptor subunit TOM40
LQGGIDGQGTVTMRANQTWSPSDVTKLQGQVSDTLLNSAGSTALTRRSQLVSEAGRSMVQIEHDHLGPHYSMNVKSMNPGLLDGTGIHIASFFHSITPRLSLGLETVFQRPQPSILETATSYFAKLTSLPTAAPSAAAALSPAGQPTPAPFVPAWTATAQLQATGNLQATYWQKLSDKVDVALDFQTVFQPASMLGPAKREAVTTLGAKYDFRMATFRGQVDSNWKVGMLLEQRFTPAFAFLVGGEIDHAKVGCRWCRMTGNSIGN